VGVRNNIHRAQYSNVVVDVQFVSQLPRRENKMKKAVKEGIAMFISEVIENGYNVEKSLNILQNNHKLNDTQISNLEELISNWNYEIEDKLGNDYEWDTFMDLVIKAVSKRV
jgi:enolase